MQTFLPLPLASIVGQRRRPARFAAAAVCFATLALAQTAGAATWTVNSLNDSGSGSLRDTIAAASPGDTIQVQASGTITLTSGELYIGRDLTIVGPGASQLAISGNHASQVFEVDYDTTVSLSGMTIQNGFAPIGAGAGILNYGTLTVTSCTISGNSAPGFGGGIANYRSLTIIRSTLSGNVVGSGGGGGGVYSGSASGSLTITDSTVSGNSAFVGGGIASQGALTISGSTISQNSAGYGGGLNQDGESTGTITNTTFSGNMATELGGAIWNNVAYALTTIRNSTVAGNSAGAGGGVHAEYFNAFQFAGALLANNVGGNCAGRLAGTSQGYNVSDDSTCAFAGTGDQNGVTPGAGLDPKGLQNNGGPTQTIALLPTSPAVDLVPAASCSLTTDQRGTTRPQGKGCDAGAYELVQTVPFSSFSGHLVVTNGKLHGFVLTSQFTLDSDAPALQLQAQTLTLQIANYTLTLPPGSLNPLWKAPNAPLAYEGTVNGVKLVIGLISLGNGNWSFDAAGAPVTITATNPVPVTLTIGQNTGTTSVRAIIQ